MQMKPICIYHGNCADGFTAAWAVQSRFGADFDYFAATYQDDPPDVTNRHVVIVDFSYKRPVLQQMARRAAGILVLDHHKSAAEDLAPEGNFGIDIRKRGNTWDAFLEQAWQDRCEGVSDAVYCLFDMDRSGAGITWDFFHPGVTRPEIVDYAEDRDLWRFNLPFSREISAFVFAHDYTFDVWHSLAAQLATRFDTCVDMGAAIEKKHHKDVAELVAKLRREMVIGGQWVPVANLPYTLTSDAGHLMCQPYASANLHGEIVTPPFAACYWDTAEGRVFSLRSVDGGEDVSAIAAQYGGGGHKHAAGFRLPHGVAP